MEITTEIVLLGVQVIAFIVWLVKLSEGVKTNKEKINSHKKHGERLAAIESKIGLWNKENTDNESPVKLTDKGRTLLEESGAKECIEKNKESLLKQFDDIDEPFDIQTKALKVAEQELQKDKKVKEYLYQSGEKDMSEVAEVAGITLRDIVLKDKGKK